jgi:hypothetical protein
VWDWPFLTGKNKKARKSLAGPLSFMALRRPPVIGLLLVIQVPNSGNMR